ncbi:MAG: hypothetical protein K0R46_1721 [Herbinix sp.]|jgi:hypothetical protein|nr:hypothetical protein [Herbinix sp.]
MAEVKKIYRESLPALRLIGKRYTDMDRGPLGGFGLKWDEWFQKRYFLPLLELKPLPESKGTPIGCMRYNDGFEYWTGMFFPEETPVPEGFHYVDIPQGDIGTCWLYGNSKSGDLYGEYNHGICVGKLMEAGWQIAENSWFFERYVESRFVVPDEQGKVILDYCIYLH